MNPKKIVIKPHKNTPAKLAKIWRKNGKNFDKTGKELKIAGSWVWQLIVKGKEPKRLDLRRKLFLTRKKLPEELEEIRLRKVYEKQQVDKEVDARFKKIFGG